MTIPVVTVGEAIAPMVGGLERLHGPVTVVRRCADLAEAVAACQSGLAQAAVIADGVEDLTATLLEQLATLGVSLLVMTDDVQQAKRVTSLGAVVIACEARAEELAASISDTVSHRNFAAANSERRDLAGPHGAAWGHADVRTAQLPAYPQAGPQVHRPLDAPAGSGGGGALEPAQGRVIAVWGPIGSPGRTTVAVNLAAELAATGRRVMVVDADSYGASVAGTLGLLDETAGIAQACRLADQGVLAPDTLARIAPEVMFRGGSFRVLTGLTRMDRWPELRSAALTEVVEQARQLCRHVVIDCGFSLENDEELSYDTMAPRRNAATLTVLNAADQIVAVAGADSIGIPRMIRALNELDQLFPAHQVSVVVNKLRTGSVGSSPESALREAWARFGPQRDIVHFLPWDPASMDRALLSGQVLLEAAADAPLRQALLRLAAEVSGAGTSGAKTAADTGRLASAGRGRRRQQRQLVKAVGQINKK
ncbi:AAA family ATPase [Psychromicrobium xiongbiense]|uniref:AAA family ATPase n=1 Tax=Psychromicrobium xiongbiense TaxID=3051184 RepID=UPI00255747CD|nr:AAA family ATPase [Psychromicrobium sp. YIM S02556]